MTQGILAHIERLKADWMALQPIDSGHAAKLHQKMRLEWNYNSNHIEGNTLTYGETELLLIFDQTKGDHEFREYEEMKGHDVALKMVEDLAKDRERELTESFICNLNKLILKEPFYKEAVTPDGQPTRRLIKIGEYKSQPNSVRLQNGEMFHYASPAETPAKMHDLLQWYRQAASDGNHHPVTLAAELHYRFVLIHPFDDGNGRISRLLMNYHLLRHDYPPVIIKSADKKNYLRALHEADTGNVAAFVDYVAEQLIWSYEISIKAAKGESVDEVGDWEKEIELLKKNKASSSMKYIKKSDEALELAWKHTLSPLLIKMFEKLQRFDSLFTETGIWLYVDKIQTLTNEANRSLVFYEIQDRFNRNIIVPKPKKMPTKIEIIFEWNGYQYNGSLTFNEKISITINFFIQNYIITCGNPLLSETSISYTNGIKENKIDTIVESTAQQILNEIQQKIKRLNNGRYTPITGPPKNTP